MTDTYGLLGFPLGHSFSKRYFTDKFEKEGIEAEFLNFEREDIGDVYQMLTEHPCLKGFTITIPHKQHIIPLLDGISEEARKVGAVNCVKVNRTDNRVSLTGYNTDVYGFKTSLQKFIPGGLQKALLLGNGGAAKAVRYVLQELGMEVVTVSRMPRNADEIGYPEVESKLGAFKLLVNTTPLGTWPDVKGCPDIPYGKLTEAHYLFDLVYNPEITEFMRRGAVAGAHTHNGLEMLHQQAEKAWNIWQSAPEETY